MFKTSKFSFDACRQLFAKAENRFNNCFIIVTKFHTSTGMSARSVSHLPSADDSAVVRTCKWENGTPSYTPALFSYWPVWRTVLVCREDSDSASVAQQVSWSVSLHLCQRPVPRLRDLELPSRNSRSPNDLSASLKFTKHLNSCISTKNSESAQICSINTSVCKNMSRWTSNVV